MTSLDPFVLAGLSDWTAALIRWLHVIAAMAWIGSSFFYMHLDATLRPDSGDARLAGTGWQVHGGGFYQMTKWKVAPPVLPPHLVWHKWQSYWTWMSGAALLGVMYYGSPSLHLIDPEVADLTPLQAAGFGMAGIAGGWVVYDLMCRSPLKRNDWLLLLALFVYAIGAAILFSRVFAGRAALIHTGALLATVMTGNVFLIIIPNQKKIIATLLAGGTPDPALGDEGKRRSSHNTYITLPVVFLMLAGHAPLTFGSAPLIPLMVALVLVAGALARVVVMLHHQGKGVALWAVAIGTGAMAGAVAISIRVAGGLDHAPAPGRSVVPRQVTEIMTSRCAMCHRPAPAWPGLAAAPKGLRLDDDDAIARAAPAIRLHAVMTEAMPPGNVTGMTGGERAVLARWVGR